MARLYTPTIITFTNGRPSWCLVASCIATDDKRFFVILYDPDPTRLELGGDEIDVGLEHFNRYHIPGAIVTAEQVTEEV